MAAEVHHVSGPGLPELVALVNLVVVVALIYVFGKRGIKSAIAQRSTDVATKLTNAREELARVEARLKKAKAEFNDLNAKKREVLESVRNEADRIAKQISEETRQNADQILSDAELSAKSEVRHAAKKIRANLVEQTFSQTLAQLEGSTAKAHGQKTEIHDRLFEKFVSEIPVQLKTAGSVKHGA